MTEYALSQGDLVVATLRKPEALSDLAAQYPADKLLVLKVDVTKQEDIDTAFVAEMLSVERSTLYNYPMSITPPAKPLSRYQVPPLVHKVHRPYQCYDLDTVIIC